MTKRMVLRMSCLVMSVCVVMSTAMVASSVGCVVSTGEKREMNVIIRMMDAQDRWFRENIIKPFEKEYHCKINVVVFDKVTDVETMLEREKTGKHETGLVKTEAPVLATFKRYMMPLEDVVGKEKMDKDMQDYVDNALGMGTFDGKVYYIPRKLEVRTMLYSKSKVADAVGGWGRYEDKINAAIRETNGYGLPAGYDLESDPNEWDLFDLFVVSYYWAHTPYFGFKMPRLAHRAKDYEGTTTFLVDRTYQMGGTQNDVLAMNTDPVIDMFEWEALFKHNKLYNPSMWKERWSGGGIWNAMKSGSVFLCFMHQIDAFFIHGGSHPTMQGFLANPNDMGLALMPMGVSLELGENGKPLRVGSRRASVTGWWWGIPKTSPNFMLSYELARWITNYENHLAECQTFGMMPIRKDVIGKLEAFPQPWMRDVFEIGHEQLSLPGTEPKPLISQWTDMSANYRNAWYDIIVGNNYHPKGKKGIDRAYISEVLDKYAEKNRRILA